MALLFNYKFILTLFLLSNVSSCTKIDAKNHSISQNNDTLPQPDLDYLEFPYNFEYLEAEWFLWGALGYGLDVIAPDLPNGGPPPIGARRAFLEPTVQSIIHQYGYIEVGHLRAINKLVKPFPRPQLDLSSHIFSKLMNLAVGYPLRPPFDPYINTINFLLASYYIASVPVTGAVGAFGAGLQSPQGKQLVGSLLLAEAYQDGVIRTLLYQRRLEQVRPYGITVEDFTNKISNLRNKLGKGCIVDEGLFVDPTEGAEGLTPLNILPGNEYSGAYHRTSEQILRVLYSTGNESLVGGFFPQGAGGRNAQSYL